MKPGDYMGFASDTTDDAAMTAFLIKHPEEIGAKLETLRTGGCILIRRKRGEQDGQLHREDSSGDDCGGGAGASDGARDREVT